MELVILIIMLALAEYTWFGWQVGQARMKYGIKGPATAGHEIFERHFRVHQNTLEQLAVFIPGMLAFSYLAELAGWPGHYLASALGAVWIIGRYVYAASYTRDPGSRSLGFLLTFVPSAILVLGSIIAALVILVG